LVTSLRQNRRQAPRDSFAANQLFLLEKHLPKADCPLGGGQLRDEHPNRCRVLRASPETFGGANVRFELNGTSALGVRREKAALSNGCESHPAIAAAGSNGAVMEVTKWLKPSVKRVTNYGDSASVQAVTRVNAEQTSKRTMRRPTRPPFRGRLIPRDG